MTLETMFKEPNGSKGMQYMGADGTLGKLESDLVETGGDALETITDLGEDVFDAVKSGGEFVIKEGKEGIDKVQGEATKLDAKNRVLPFMPNSVLVGGAIGLLIYSTLK